MVDTGKGPVILMIPGIQGRWEWMSPAVTALSRRCRVISDSLPGDHGSSGSIDPEKGFQSYVGWIDKLLDKASVQNVSLCGISYGGLIALYYAACRSERIQSLILASTPAPKWKPSCQVKAYLLAPRVMSPIFALTSPLRLYPEITTTFPNFFERLSFTVKHLGRVTRHPFAPSKMARRVQLLEGIDFEGACARVTSPTLVVTGEAQLDRVVSVDGTKEYVRLVKGANWVCIEKTGHIGLISRPECFSEVVSTFIANH